MDVQSMKEINTVIHVYYRLDNMKFLVKSGSSLKDRNNDGNSCTLQAAEHGRLHLLNWLGDNGCSIYDTNIKGDTCLLLAAKNGHTALVKYIYSPLFTSKKLTKNLNNDSCASSFS